MSKDELDRMIPVSPPMVNKKMKPPAHIMGVSSEIWDPAIVAIHLKAFTPVGMAITIVAAVK
jgi:hypothetical protein